MENHPFLNPKFPIQWSRMTPDIVEDEINLGMKIAEENIEKIASLKDDEITFENTFEAFDKYDELLNIGWERFSNLNTCHDNPEQRAKYQKLRPIVIEFATKVYINDRLWHVLQAAKERFQNTDLDYSQKRLIEEVCLDFIHNGANLPQDKKQRITEISKEMATANTKFVQNVLDSTNAFEYYVTDPKELEGLPESAILQAKESAESKGKPGQWRFTLQYPSRFPVMQHAKSESFRRAIWEANNKVASEGEYDNTENIFKILKLRDEKAKILGYKSFADLTLSRRMAKTQENAMKFIDELHDKIYKPFIREHEQLLKYKSSKTGKEETEIYPWERAYYTEMQRKELYDFDEESLRPYFNADSVLKGLFNIASTIYGFNVVERPTYCKINGEEPQSEDSVEVWDKDIQFFDVYDKETNTHIASFYSDFYPRENKKEGGWTHPLSNGTKENPIIIAVIAGNLQKPTEGKASQLNHREVETIFHEFGHLCHHVSSRAKYNLLFGTNVSWDFVELPSQILENWTWERSALDIFAKHYETNENIPNDLYEKMINARNYNKATFYMRQLSFGKIDLEIHSHLEKYVNMSIKEINDEVLKDYMEPCSIKPNSILYVFNHLFSSSVAYAAGYYSYLWAEVLDADAFSRFKKEGVLNPKVGMEFRKKILEYGNTKPPEELYRDFMGRDPDQRAFLERSGIKFDE
ncbi:Oligopeptidase A [Histomonas meleagridis]|uniref:Oligopeptidase A n=1 Tax=Histomonas meleagridis TaxID=135588 RepID=UPI003559D29F|nr:Oligopeptidase A [Histomonas meleagridis]KAH0799644.1 Oligopeptidase A [Histomonas meleagridis]